MKRFFVLITLISLAIFASYSMLLGSGFFPQADFVVITIFSLFILLFSGSAKSFYFGLLPISLCYITYMPIGINFGPPSYQYVASVFATDLQESREFLAQLPLYDIILAVASLLSLFIIRALCKKFHIQFQRNQTFVTLSLTLFFFVSPIAKFITEGIDSITKVKTELQWLNTMNIESGWGKSQLKNQKIYDDYVLIIGESARRDYHHAYGYPIENTPFMSHANGTLIDGLTAGGTNTIASLKVMLTKPNPKKWEGHYALSLVDLVKSAGLQTYWLSNQGYLGIFDTPISSLANKSDEKFFTKSGDSFSQNISDFALLPKFEQLIQQKTSTKRFIVLHLYGSHPLSCDRLTDYTTIFNENDIDKKYHNLNCYISSIKKTDEFIRKVYEGLQYNQQKNGRTFSMIYFADHGLSHAISENNIDMLNMTKSPLHLNIPLFKISSDDTQRKVYKAFKSGLNFTDGIANWIGIENEKLNPNVDLFSPQNDSDDYGLKNIIEQFNTPVDPAIVIKKR
ncbi:hypothetical protein A6B43_07715 [Vespertiliibacter pulmonis]|uniref:Glucan phosphoethanolaminetransferase (Alkaline phosphatase superfamily) n=1 Tax=Vespertiliibacter pulmonis TaxID=1443036 RepID=A0A3N4VRV2_9PAST|nr:phosphoethanolamine transferase [Vespertiliibacter pulmonis]QLB21412.1 hypothetical protein A6B43_07715 [Vespertiliibacter pulmonis]RPE85826.1 glucan phosphoethanolaminetransferase (alkaline phosphatase superfamily) [Vespertiliibacter pulmonis]